MSKEDEQTSKILKTDIIAETEKILGNKSYKEFDKLEEGFNFARFLNHNKNKTG